ncbi:hypothetical protein L3X38_037117 [Prunus dulcis]|uniref:Reverse transcriptase domain-containing protein n=1 Tax=Prunus dulcis TaxID=3755 RepID=A0AAD4YQC5_PRUDU|nr:hypothetical protein L3X38_037117 [Prunus dulcis]
MDAYSGYNQIMMHEDDKAKTFFIIERGTYCYKVMPFGLKNAGATYQRLVNKIFKKQIGKTMEAYTHADTLASQDQCWIPSSDTLSRPRVEEVEPVDTIQIDEDLSGQDPIIDYLVNGNLPIDKFKARKVQQR